MLAGDLDEAEARQDHRRVEPALDRGVHHLDLEAGLLDLVPEHRGAHGGGAHAGVAGEDDLPDRAGGRRRRAHRAGDLPGDRRGGERLSLLQCGLRGGADVAADPGLLQPPRGRLRRAGHVVGRHGVHGLWPVGAPHVRNGSSQPSIL